MGSNKWTRELPDNFWLTADCFSSNSENKHKRWLLTRRGVNPPAITIGSDPDDPNGSLNIFSRIREGNQTISDPKEFIKSPEINDFSLSWIQFSYSPLESLNISALCWVPDPGTVCGVLRMNNLSKQERIVHVDLIGQLSMKSRGIRIKGLQYAGRDLLNGKLGSKDLLLFLSGNTKISPDPHPCLTSEYVITPDEEKELRWIAVIGASRDESLLKIERYINLDWEGEISRSRISRQGRVEITTGDKDWDFAFSLAQKEAESFCMQHLPNKISDQDPAFYLSPIQVLSLLEALAPVDRDLGVKIIENALLGMGQITQNEILSPIKADKTPDLPLAGENIKELVDLHGPGILDQKIISQLEGSLMRWFYPDNDQDQDGIPELSSLDQFNLIDLYHTEGENQLNRIGYFPYLESPGLAAVLFNDLKQFNDLAHRSGRAESNLQFQDLGKLLKDFIHESWNQEDSIYYTRDRDTHMTLPGRIILTDPKSDFTVLREELPVPSRIGVFIQGEEIRKNLSRLCITIHGTDTNGLYRIEQITLIQVQYLNRYSWGVSETSYKSLDYLTVVGLDSGCSLIIFQPNSKREDISHLLPLWGGTISKSRSADLINNTLMNPEKYFSPFGLRSFPDPSRASVQLPWNVLLGRGLLKNGKRKLAADLFTNLIKAIIINLKETGNFFAAYEATSGKGIGMRNPPYGLVPVGFFLEISGVKILPEREISVEGEYPFPWPLKLRYQGYLIHRDADQTRIDIPGEEPRIVKGSDRFVIPLHSSSSENFSTW